MIERTISAEAARRFYDRLGAAYGLAEAFEGRAKALARRRLGLAPGQRVANVGAGPDHARLAAAVRPGGLAVAIDLSPTMLAHSRARTGAPACRADARHLPLRTGAVDRLFCAYLLDLLPLGDLPVALAEFHRVLRPGGRAALVSLTEGTNASSRLVMKVWKVVYRWRPSLLGGCRPVRLAGLVGRAGFASVTRQVVVQLGMPSEVIVAARTGDGLSSAGASGRRPWWRIPAGPSPRAAGRDV
jgi:SAM-dependent methyltransferase